MSQHPNTNPQLPKVYEPQTNINQSIGKMLKIIIIIREKLTLHKTITGISNFWDCWGKNEPRDGECGKRRS